MKGRSGGKEKKICGYGMKDLWIWNERPVDMERKNFGYGMKDL